MNLSQHDQRKAKNYIRLEKEEDLISAEARIISDMPHFSSEDIRLLRIDMSPATPETKRRVRMRPDPLLTLRAKGLIGDNDLLAAEYIQAAYALIAADVAVKTAKLEISSGGCGNQQEESAWAIRVQEQYADWHDRCDIERIPTGPILRILTEDVTLEGVDKIYHKRRNFTRESLIKGLAIYVKLFKPTKRI